LSIPTPCGTSSVDDLGLGQGQVSPDPFLDEFKPESSGAPGSEDPDAATGPAPSSLGISAQGALQPSQASSWSALDIDLDVPPSASASTPALASSTSGQFAGLDLSSLTPSKRKSAPVRGRDKTAAKDEEDEYEDLPSRGSNLPMALLFSYASAVTIGLIWLLWGRRLPRETVEADPFPPADTSSDPGHRADQSRKLVPPPPLTADRIVRLGQTVRLGSLEVTPREITTGTVTLVREINRNETRPGGEGALLLKLRLKNLSSDSILVPLDEAFLRERGRGIRDSFVETGPISQIDMYPLAVVSEWSIVGQEFRELRPNESYETQIVSAPDATAHLVPEMTWRIRLRTDINQTETLGVRFREKDVRKATTGRGSETL
jgi:hypothetical protein